MNFYKHHLGDYDGATAHLSWEEDMAYTRLLRAYYRREKPLPSSQNEIFRLVRATTNSQKRSVVTVLHEFFAEQQDGWHNKRADEEISSYQAQASTNRRIARERTVQRTVLRVVNGSSTKGSPNHKPLTINQEPEKKHTGRKRPAVSLPEGFAISSKVREWAEEKGFKDLEAHLEHFLGWARATGRTYADWDQAFMNAIRDDWAKVRANGEPDYSQVIANLQD